MTHMLKKHVAGNKLFDEYSCRFCSVQEANIVGSVSAHHKISTITDIQNPSYCSCKYGNSSFVDVRLAFRGYQEKADC